MLNPLLGAIINLRKKKQLVGRQYEVFYNGIGQMTIYAFNH